MEFEEVRYGMLLMVLCDRWGRVYDVWISFGSVHEVRAETGIGRNAISVSYVAVELAKRIFGNLANVKVEAAKAEFKDGVLEIRIPKAEGSKEKKIEIS